MSTSRKAKRPAAAVKAKPQATKSQVKLSAKPAVAAVPRPPARKPGAPLPEWVVEMRDHLLRRREQMQSVVRSNRDQLAESQKNYADIGDRASEGFGDELAAGLLSIESAQLEEIEEALSRINGGTFGVCADCAKPIPRKRLEVLPFAKRCLTCEGQKERSARSYSATEEEEESGLD